MVKWLNVCLCQLATMSKRLTDRIAPSPPESDPVDEDHGRSRVDAGQRSVCRTSEACHQRHRRRPEQSTVGAYGSSHCPAAH